MAGPPPAVTFPASAPFPFPASIPARAVTPGAALPAACATHTATISVHLWPERNVLVAKLDSSEATAWRDMQFGAGRNQTLAFEEVEGAAVTTYGSGYLDLTSTAGVMTSDLGNWSTDPTSAFTIVVIQSLKTQSVDWNANYLVAELSCSAAPSTSGFLFGTREAYISGPHSWQNAFHTSNPVPVEQGFTLHAFARKQGGTEGAYYYAGASGGIALREAFRDQPRIAVGADSLTVGTSLCMGSAKSRTLLGAVLLYNRALSPTDLKRVYEAYAPRFNWTRGGSMRRNAINSTFGTNSAAADFTTCFSRPNYGNYYCIKNWDIKGTNIQMSTPMDKSTCLGTCDTDPLCQFAGVAIGGLADCVTRKNIFGGINGATQLQTSLGPAFETCIKAKVYPRAVECGKWTKGGPGETRLQRDCDGDGIMDAVLFDTTGARGVALSSKGCSTDDADTGYPNAPESACPIVLSNLCPQPPSNWCPGGKVIQIDCDGDGAKDLACLLRDDRRSLRVIRSGLGCFPGQYIFLVK
ncbi:hypothetical protein HYH03_007233 [Edaphochlamys debaryana]|uniref:Uncharacterized protein n=1 Tax=Edaphochlamys debaryana TaxID=47281 RepID=A0A835YBY6_9CHLO|nr:hypothetical protein HYH03_007233 [Edaphochlamys debaryana]|eukprot:KAG2494719.1 hypothetical protein HYH03_007233 [Edaphochlamys debaryana]